MRPPQTTTLDPDARTVIDRMNALNAPGYEAMPPAAARAIAAQLRKNTPVPRLRVGAVDDIDLAAGTTTMKARQYRPFRPRPQGGAAAMIFLHGGGWTLGDLDTMDHLCRSLVRQAGIDVISLDYPLAPETRFPDTPQLCARAVRSIFDRTAALGLDPARIAIGGDSSGGNLAAVLALMARQGELSGFRAQCLIYPALDLRARDTAGDPPPDTVFLRAETMDWFLDNYLGPATPENWRASPLLAPDLSGLPPSYVLTAGYDVLRGAGLAYVERLQKAGVTTIARDFPGQIHNFIAMPHAIPTAYAAIADIAEFLVEHLCGEIGA